LLETDTLRPGTRVAVLESMRVVPEARGRGVGGRLVAAFFDWAKERGAVRASVTAYTANEGAQRFYARHGFVPASVTLRATL
jgi:GNAT superfamily N-acetyltransferase